MTKIKAMIDHCGEVVAIDVPRGTTAAHALALYVATRRLDFANGPDTGDAMTCAIGDDVATIWVD